MSLLSRASMIPPIRSRGLGCTMYLNDFDFLEYELESCVRGSVKAQPN